MRKLGLQMNSKQKRDDMPQISVIVPDDIQELLSEVAKETGRSVSSLCADYIADGVYGHVERLNKVEVWRGQLAKRKLKANTEGDKE
jgi:predicted transcriptional regulator